jgi:hypothetical protein
VADDGLIRLGMYIDLSGLQDSMDEATAKVESFSSDATEAVQTLADAYAQLDAQGINTVQTMNAIADAAAAQAQAVTDAAAAQAEAAQAEAAANLEKIASMSAVDIAYRQLAIAQAEANRANQQKSAAYKNFGGDTEGFLSVSVMAAAEANAAEASMALAAAKANLADAIELEEEATIPATVAVDGLAVAETEATVATTGLGISSRQSATAGIGILEGRLMSGNRAASAFLSTTLGLGPVLQAAFPIIGAIAMADVLIQIGKGAYDAYEKFVSLDDVTNKLTEDFKKTQQTDVINVHSLETAVERLDQANEKATNLRESAQALHDVSIGGFLHDLGSQNFGAVATDIGGLIGAKKIAEDSAQATKNSIALTKIQVEEEHQLRLAKIEAAHAGDSGLDVEEKRVAQLQKEIALHAEAQRYSREQDRAMGNPVAPDQGKELKTAQDSAAMAQAAAQYQTQTLDLQHKINDAKIAAYYADEAGLDAQDKIDWEMQKELAMHAEAQAASTTGRPEMDQQLRDLQDEATIKKNTAQSWIVAQDKMTESFLADVRAQDKAREQSRRADEAATEDWKKRHQEQIDIGKQAADATIKAAQDQYELTERNIKFQEQLGNITARTAEQELLAAEKLKEESTQGALGKEQGLFDPVAGNKELQEYTQIQDKMDEEARKGALQREQIAQQEALRIEQQYKKMFNMFNTDMVEAVDKWAMRTQSASQAFAQMFGKIEIDLANFVIKWVLQQTEMWAATAIAALTGSTTLKTINMQNIKTDAATAAANTYNAVSAIPIVGPALAPAAASVAYGAVMAFETFDQGGMVSQTGLVMAHAREGVLTPAQTRNFQSMTENYNGGAKATLNQTNHFGGSVTPEMLASHSAQTIGKMKALLRPEAFK